LYVAEVVLQALDQDRRQVLDVACGPIDEVVVEDRDDLVVGVVVVHHLQPANHARPHDDLAARDRSLAQHTDVEWITIPRFDVGDSRCTALPQYVRGMKP
jgi:hypothetical protein